MPTPVENAKIFAIERHGEQRYGSAPYAVHLQSVACLVRPYGEWYEVVAWLHDMLEDTCVDQESWDETLGEIGERFGQETATAVDMLSDDPGLPRAQAKERTYQRIAKTRETKPYSLALQVACTVKTADRLANLMVSASVWDRRRIRMYLGEHAEFMRTYGPSCLDTMSARLHQFVSDLAFYERHAPQSV